MEALINRWIKSVAIVLFFLPMLSHSLTIEPQNNWNGIFTGKTSAYGITILNNNSAEIALSWKLKVKGRVLSSGRKNIFIEGETPKTVSLPLQTPQLNSGISLDALLIIKTNIRNPKNKIIQRQIKIKLFGPNVLTESTSFFKQLNIQLYDPFGNTSKVFDDLNIPYNSLSKHQLFNPISAGLIIIGEGVELNKQRGLVEVLTEFAKKGQKILILNPSSGEIILPKSDNPDEVTFPSITFSTNNRSQLYNNAKWLNHDPYQEKVIIIKNHRQQMLAQVVDNKVAGWNYFFMNYTESGGRFFICTLPFLSYTNHKPNAQIMLTKVIALASDPNQVKKSK